MDETKELVEAAQRDLRSASKLLDLAQDSLEDGEYAIGFDHLFDATRLVRWAENRVVILREQARAVAS